MDYADHDVVTAWQHYPAWDRVGRPYCPRCECVGLGDEQIIDWNRDALMEARVAVLDLRTHSIGTPIEMFWRCWVAEKPAILIAKEGSVFVRETARRFNHVWVVDHPSRTVRIVETLING